MNKNELFEQAIKKLNTDEGILEEDYVKLLEPLFARQKEKIKEKVDYTENNEGKLTFFLYEDDAKELQEWGLNCRYLVGPNGEETLVEMKPRKAK